MKTPYDGRFKILAEEYPDLLLRLLGIVKPGRKTQLIDILRELHLDPVQVDHVYRVGNEGSARMVHFEAITRWHAQRVPLLALYRFLLKQRFKLPVSSYLVLMAEKYAPRNLPKRVVYEEDDGFRIEAPYKTIRLWEIDPALAFEPGCEPLLPWVPLLRGGEAEFEQSAAAIEELLDHREDVPYAVEGMVSDLAALASLRYDKDAIRHFLERLREKTMLSTDLFTESWLYQEGKAEGIAKGKAEGMAEGKAEGIAEGETRGLLTCKRSDLHLALQTRFPEIEDFPEIDQLDQLEVLDELLLALLKARTADEARSALISLLRP